jgi:membrane-associated phospholipid phosphatase
LTARAKAPAGPRRPAIIRPLLPAAARPLVWVLTVCCAVIVAGLPVLFAHHSGLDWLDRSVDPRIHGMYGARYDMLRWLAKPGELIPVAALIVIIAVTCLVTGRVSGAVLAVVAVPVAIELTEHVLKPLTGRTKLGFLSYPSGHATATFALAAVLAVLMLNPPGRALTPVLRLIVPAAAVALACVASTAMIGLGFHYFTDTIAGAAVGIGTVTATALVLDLPGPRRWLAAVGGRDEPLLSRFNARVRAHGGLGQVADRDQVLASGDTTPFGVVRADSPVS